MIRLFLRDLLQRDLVIPMDLHLRTHLAKVLDEIVGEGVVIVDDQEHGDWAVDEDLQLLTLLGNGFPKPL